MLESVSEAGGFQLNLGLPVSFIFKTSFSPQGLAGSRLRGLWFESVSYNFESFFFSYFWVPMIFRFEFKRYVELMRLDLCHNV